MSELHLPWLELSVLFPLLGACWVRVLRRPETARLHAVVISGITLLFAVGAWRDFILLHTFESHDRWDLGRQLLQHDLFVIDELSAPLLPLGALVYFLTQLATLRTKVRRFSFTWALVSEAILLATFACKEAWPLTLLLVAGVVPPLLEMQRRHKPTRLYLIHMGLFTGLAIIGQLLVQIEGSGRIHSTIAVLILAIALLIRSGMAPLHCWLIDLMDRVGFGASLNFITPMVGAYGAMRLVLPIAPDWILEMISTMSLLTAVYAAGMTLVQTDVRRFFCYLFLSQSSLLLVGMETANPIGLTGALCIWISVCLAMTGFGLTLRAVESRCGSLSLKSYHGLYEHMPHLAAFFLLTGLAAIGFPGTIGFVAVELLVEGANHVSSLAGVTVIATTALNGLAVMFAYFRIFTGIRHASTIDLRIRPSERFAALVLTMLILVGGLWPQPGVASRYHAAMRLVADRHKSGLDDESDAEPARINEEAHPAQRVGLLGPDY